MAPSRELSLIDDEIKDPHSFALALQIDNPRVYNIDACVVLRNGRNNPRFFKVPAEQRRANNEVFDPVLFSFGPYHAGAACLTDGEHLKRLVATHLEGYDCLGRLADRIQQHEPELRYLYIQMSKAQRHEKDIVHPAGLAELLALDSILIVSTALRQPPYDFFIQRMVLRDALLLENQVPIFALRYALESLHNEVSLLDVLQHYCTMANPFPTCKFTGKEALDEVSLLGYFYDFLIETRGYPTIEAHDLSFYNCNKPVLPTASRLLRFGLRFTPCVGGFCGIKFCRENMELFLPNINVDDSTLRILCNLLAYEATTRDCFREPFPVMSYVYIMDCLINTEEDVQVLVDAGIIENLLGSHQELASSWNRICTSVSLCLTPADFKIIWQVQKLSKKRWRELMADFKEKYWAFKNKYWKKQPWLLISIITAAILLGLSLLQTIYTIKGTLNHQ